MNRALAAALLLLAAPALVSAGSLPSQVAPGVVSTEENEYNLSVSDDGRTMVFARSEADFEAAKIMVAERRGRGRWSKPRPISFSDERWRDSDPWLTPDGNTLYFVSDRPTPVRPGKRDLDIWRSTKAAGGWSPPEHLGEVVNGPGEELGPEYHGEMLYFATARKSGMGGLDIYASRQTAAGFSKPELLPAPINSASSESDFTISRDGKLAFFWRMVEGRGLIHLSRRSPEGSWSEAEPLRGTVNAGSFNYTPAFSRDGRRLTFASNVQRKGQPEGMADVFEIDLLSVVAGRSDGR